MDFKDLLALAQKGNTVALKNLIEMYMPLINKHSTINGIVNEDLRQCIFLKIIININKFKIEGRSCG